MNTQKCSLDNQSNFFFLDDAIPTNKKNKKTKSENKLSSLVYSLNCLSKKYFTVEERIDSLKKMFDNSLFECKMKISSSKVKYKFIIKEQNNEVSLEVSKKIKETSKKKVKLEAKENFDSNSDNSVDQKYSPPFLRICRTADNQVDTKMIRHEMPSEFKGLATTLAQYYDLSDHIVVLALEDWKSIFQGGNELQFSEKLRKIKCRMTYVCDPKAKEIKSWWQAWVQIKEPCESYPNGKYLNILLLGDSYDSNTLAESEITEFSSNEELLEDQKYYFIKIFDDKDLENKSPLLVNRFCPRGNLAELLHIQAIPGVLSGNEMRELFHCSIISYLQPKWCVLYDDAKVDIQTGLKQKVNTIHLNLRKLRGGESWYQSIGYAPFKCINKATLTCEDTVTQFPEYYYAAAKKIQNTTILEIFDFIKKSKGQTKTLKQIVSVYSVEKTTVKLIELVSKVARISREEKNFEKRVKINEDLLHLYENYLTPFELKKSESLERKIYNLALSIIDQTHLFARRFQSEKTNLKNNKLRETGEINFDKSVKSIVKKYDVSVWDEFIPHIIIDKKK